MSNPYKNGKHAETHTSSLEATHNRRTVCLHKAETFLSTRSVQKKRTLGRTQELCLDNAANKGWGAAKINLRPMIRTCASLPLPLLLFQRSRALTKTTIVHPWSKFKYEDYRFADRE